KPTCSSPPAPPSKRPAREPRPSVMTVSRSPSPAIEATRPAGSTPSSSVAALLHQKVIHVLPTACVVLDTGKTTFKMGAMIDPCMAVSSIDRSLAASYRLPTVEVGEDEVCSATIRSRTGSFSLEVILRIDPSLKIRTPT
ncbi:hypothetical protein KR200_011306, partial [Drosophila serrata]